MSKTAATEAELSQQVAQLQADLKAITKTIEELAAAKVGEAQSAALTEAEKLVRSGRQAVAGVEDEFGELEKQLKDTIRERPLTAIAGALALGFFLAAVTR